MRWTPDERREWRATLRLLRQQFPAGKVVVRRRPMKQDFGLGQGRCGEWRVTINANRDYAVAVYTLYEEWAHMLVYPEEKHSDSWGRRYAKIIRAMEDG